MSASSVNELFPIVCLTCSAQFKDEAELARHIMGVHKTTPVPEQKYVQTVFTPQDLRIIEHYVVLGTVHFSNILGRPRSAASAISEVVALTELAVLGPEAMTATLDKLMQLMAAQKGT